MERKSHTVFSLMVLFSFFGQPAFAATVRGAQPATVRAAQHCRAIFKELDQVNQDFAAKTRRLEEGLVVFDDAFDDLITQARERSPELTNETRRYIVDTMGSSEFLKASSPLPSLDLNGRIPNPKKYGGAHTQFMNILNRIDVSLDERWGRSGASWRFMLVTDQHRAQVMAAKDELSKLLSLNSELSSEFSRIYEDLTKRFVSPAQIKADQLEYLSEQSSWRLFDSEYNPLLKKQLLPTANVSPNLMRKLEQVGEGYRGEWNDYVVINGNYILDSPITPSKVQLVFNGTLPDRL